MTWFCFCYWYEPDAPEDPVGLVRVWRLAESLTQAGESVTLFPPRYRSALTRRVLKVIPISLIHLPLIRPLSYALLSFVQGLARALLTRPDVVYYRWMDSPHVLILAKLLRVPCICEVNGEPIPDWLSERTRFGHRHRHRLAGLALRHCDRIVVLTEGLRTLLHTRYHVSLDRIAVFPSGTDVQRFLPQDIVEARRQRGLPLSCPYIGFVGSFYRYQGLTCLLEALALVKEALPTVHLLLVGDGEAMDGLREQSKRLNLERSIIWTGRVPYEDVPGWIGAMNLCVAPFRKDRGETSPVKLFDYLACRRPVIASVLPSVVSAFPAESGVEFVPPDQPRLLADAIIALLQDPDRCEVMGKQGRRFVENRFSWSAIAQQLRDWIGQDTRLKAHAHSHVL